jgi:Fic family protein
VQIGAGARFVPPPANYLRECLDQFENYLHQPKAMDPLVEAFIVHYQFEAIHPFRDGNGRVGRLLLAITIEDWCGLSGQWLYMSAYFEKYKDDYIERLYRVSTEGDWSGWLRFCLQGVAEQAVDAQERCSRLLSLKEDYRARLDRSGCPGRVYQIVEDLFVRPFTTAPWIKDKYQVSYPTARSDLERLVKMEILNDMALRLRRQKAYLCEDIFRITYGDTVVEI